MVGPVLWHSAIKGYEVVASGQLLLWALVAKVAFGPQASRVYLSCRKVIRETLGGSQTKCQTG